MTGDEPTPSHDPSRGWRSGRRARRFGCVEGRFRGTTAAGPAGALAEREGLLARHRGGDAGRQVRLPAHSGSADVAEQAVHFGRAQAAYFARLELLEAPKATEATDATAVKAYVAQSFDYVRDVLAKAGEAEFLRRDVAMGFDNRLHTTQDLWFRAALHTAHHRGQLIVYLRLNGITPPECSLRRRGDEANGRGYTSTRRSTLPAGGPRHG